MTEQWVAEIEAACRKARTAFFFKQWGGVRKKSTGRHYRGRTFDEMPRAVEMSWGADDLPMTRGVHAAAARSSLSAPRMTILSASSGNGRCSAFASSHGAEQDHRHRLRMDRLDHRVRRCRQRCGPGTGFDFLTQV
jgi:hypothetical protein